jgi:hypothetical protein
MKRYRRLSSANEHALFVSLYISNKIRLYIMTSFAIVMQSGD